jgi:hypothetical protein
MPIDTKYAQNIPSLPIPRWAEVIAQDADGAWWASEVHPNQHDTGWYENEVGRIQRLGQTGAPADFQEMLTKLTETIPSPTD